MARLSLSGLKKSERHDQSRATSWRTLKIFFIYRTVLALSLTTLFFTGTGPAFLGQHSPALFALISITYLCLSHSVHPQTIRCARFVDRSQIGSAIPRGDARFVAALCGILHFRTASGFDRRRRTAVGTVHRSGPRLKGLGWPRRSSSGSLAVRDDRAA